MKQHISAEQLSELTQEQKDRLREWWEPSLHDLFMCGENASPLTVRKTTYEGSKIYCGVQDVPLRFYIQSKLTYEDYCLDKKDTYRHKSQCLPLLSIGQCIELLKDKGTLQEGYVDEYGLGCLVDDTYLNGSVKSCWQLGIIWAIEKYPEFIDALWQAVKEVLLKEGKQWTETR